MNLDDLERCCDEAEAFEKQTECGAPANFNVMVPGIKYGRVVRIAPKLTGLNLGHYPPERTMVNLDAAKVRKWIAEVRAKEQA